MIAPDVGCGFELLCRRGLSGGRIDNDEAAQDAVSVALRGFRLFAKLAELGNGTLRR